jgi:hypothetical protein
MKKTNQSMLGIIAVLSVPANIDEFNSFCTGGDTVLTYGIQEAYYRNVAPKIRSRFLTAVEEATGIKPRVVSTKKNTKGEDVEVLEKDTVYIKNVLANGWTAAQLQPLLQKAFDDVGWDLASTRQTGPNAKDKAMVEKILERIEGGASTYERVKAKFEELNPTLDIEVEEDGSISEENLAEACRVDRIRRECADDILG